MKEEEKIMRKIALLALVGASFCGTNLFGAPVLFAGNGHYYDLITTGANFATARANALASTFMGQQGYLATITSGAENTFVHSLLNGQTWAGGSDSVVEGQWRWLDGPEAGVLFSNGNVAVTYANWNGGEPNNSGGEHFLILGQFGNTAATWNDGPGGSTLAYLIEYNAPSTIPEPSTVGLVGSALAALAVLRKRKS
jgi:hypothetical protein